MPLPTSHRASQSPSPTKIGRAAEMIVEAKCLLKGLACFTPVSNDGRIDLLVGPNAYRCQIKVLGKLWHDDDQRYLPLMKCGGRAGARVRFRYTAQDVDFMIGVRLDTKAVYIVPIGRIVDWTRYISELELARLGTKEAFHLFTAASGAPTPMVQERRPRRRRPSRAWVDRASLPLGLSFHDAGRTDHAVG